MHDPGLITLIVLVLGGSVFLLTLISTNAAMVFLIFSMLFSPEIRLAGLPERAVVLRFDDLLLGVVFFTWLAKLAINKELGVLRGTPINLPLGLFILSGVVSTGWGIVNGSVTNPAASFFYFLKYFEYFLLFFMVANVVREPRQIELFLKALFLTAFLVGIYAYWQIVQFGGLERLTAPFEDKPEPNTLAGYFLVIIAACAGVALYAPRALWRLLPIGLIVWLLPPFLYTYSRGGYAAFLTAFLTLCLLSQRHKLVLFSLLLLGALVASAVLPATVIQRLASTFDPRGSLQFVGMRLSPSAAQRVIVWEWIFEKWKQHPVLGFGVTGLGVIVDQQYALVIGELGIVGFLTYLWVRWCIFVHTYRIFKTIDDPLAKGLSLGFLVGLVGLLVHSFAGNIFIIVRIMEPFWLLAGMVMALPLLFPSPHPPPPRPPMRSALLRPLAVKQR